MTSDLPVYLIDGKYPDPHDLLRLVRNSRNNLERSALLSSIRSAGLSTHPLLQYLFVES